jgi:hypothetical protein
MKASFISNNSTPVTVCYDFIHTNDGHRCRYSVGVQMVICIMIVMQMNVQLTLTP